MSAAARPDRIADRIGTALARFLGRCRPGLSTAAPRDAQQLLASLRPADVLLVEGDTRFSTAIKTLTQSTWWHAALFVGGRLDTRSAQAEMLQVIEADVVEGVRAVLLSAFAGMNVRICRAVSLTAAESQAVIDTRSGVSGTATI